MEWTDIFSGPAFEPVKSRELHLGKDCDLASAGGAGYR